MKLPYQRGDSFALPLGNGRFADSWIVQCEHRVVVIAVPCGDDAPLVLRVSDDALVLQRWKKRPFSSPPALHDTDVSRAANTHWMLAARAERVAAAALGAPHPRERHVRVVELRSDTIGGALSSVDDDTVLALAQPLNPAALDALRAAIHDHPGVSVRVHGRGMAQLHALAHTRLRRLTIGSGLQGLPVFPDVRELAVIGRVPVEEIAASFPALERLSIDANGARVDLRPLRTLLRLRSLELAAADLETHDAFAGLTQIAALRLNRVTGIADASSFAPLPLRALALEHLHELVDLRDVGRIDTLEQLELRGLWQFEIADVEWALDRENLLRAEIDIGGRRKNVELYKRAAWAYPWPFPGTLSL